MDGQQSEFQRLVVEFETHVAISEERWKSMFAQLSENRKHDTAVITDLKVQVEKLNKLVWSIGGSVILVLASALLAVVLK